MTAVRSKREGAGLNRMDNRASILPGKFRGLLKRKLSRQAGDRHHMAAPETREEVSHRIGDVARDGNKDDVARGLFGAEDDRRLAHLGEGTRSRRGRAMHVRAAG